MRARLNHTHAQYSLVVERDVGPPHQARLDAQLGRPSVLTRVPPQVHVVPALQAEGWSLFHICGRVFLCMCATKKATLVLKRQWGLQARHLRQT